MPKPAILDGPYRGKHLEVEGLHSFTVRVAIPISGSFLCNPQIGLDFTMPYNEITYYIHMMKFGKRAIMTASVSPIQPSEDDAFYLLFSDYAKEAEYI